MRTYSQWQIVLVLALALGLCAGAGAQQSLKELAEQEGTDWLLGTWTATTPEGTEVTVTYAWTAGGHAARVEWDMGSVSGAGLIYYSASDDEVREFGVNSQGQTTKGTWTTDGVKLTSIVESEGPYGETQSFGIARSRAGAGKVLIEIYEADGGELAASPVFSFEMEKKEEKK